MKRVFIQIVVFLQLISLNNNILYGDVIKYPNGDVYEGEVKRKFPNFWEKMPHGKGGFSWADGSFHEGDFKNGSPNGFGKRIYTNGNIYEGDFVDWVQHRKKGRFTIVDRETKKLLFTQVYDENGIMENVEYLYKEGSLDRLAINYNKINRALNRNEINNSEDLMKYLSIDDKYGNKIEDQSNCNIEVIKQCAQYQMQTRLKGDSGKLDNKWRIIGGSTSLENLIVLAGIATDIKVLKRTRFEIGQNNPNYWPANTYNDIESYLNSLGLTKGELSTDKLTSINTLISNGINYISINVVTNTKDHAVSSTIDLDKIKNNKNDFIYVYDSSRIVDNPNAKGDLGNLQTSCQLYNHVQQELGTCWYHASCSTITAAEHPEIIGKIRNQEIQPVPIDERYVTDSTKFNDFEILQIIKLQEVAEYLEVGRLGYKAENQEFTKSGNRPRMIYHIVNDNTRMAIKEMISSKYSKNNKQTNCLEKRLGAYKSLLYIAVTKGLDPEKIIMGMLFQANNKANNNLFRFEFKLK